MAKRKGKYYVRPDGLHETIKRIDGKRVAFRGKTDTEVDKKILAYNTDLPKEAVGKLFSAVAEEWWNEIEPTLASNSTKNYKPAYNRANAQFGSMTVSEITSKDVDNYIKDFSKGRARKTVATQLQIIRQIMRKAELEGEITHNPATSVRPPKNLTQTRRSSPSKEELIKIKESRKLPFGLFAFLVYETGCRRGEALALTGADIDRVAKLVHIRKSIYYAGNSPHVKQPKTESGMRDVPLLDALDGALPKRLRNGFLFSEDGGKTPLTNDRFTKLYDGYREASGVTVTPHQIRHGYATVLFENGIDSKTAQILLGHAQISTTLDIYTHVCSDVISAAAKKMNAGF